MPIVDPTTPWMQAAPWYVRWFQDPQFAADVAAQWNALRNNGVIATWLSSIATQSAALQKSQVNNFSRWPMQGMAVWPNAEAAGSYAGEVTYLTNWIGLRIAYLDSLFNSKSPTQTTVSLPSGPLRVGGNSSLSAHVSGVASSGSVYFLSNGVVVGSSSLDAAGNAQISSGALPAGSLNVKAIYSGDAVNALSSSDGTSITVEPALLPVVVSIAPQVLDPGTTDRTKLSIAVLNNSGAVVPTGTVQMIGSRGTVLGVATLANGSANFDASGLSTSVSSLQAVYSGDATYQGGSSSQVGIRAAGFRLF